MGLPGFFARLARAHGILIPQALIRKRTPFTVLEDIAFENRNAGHKTP
jgi:hypothetical protein